MSDSLVLAKLEEINKRLELLEKKPAGLRVSWEDKVTESGIQLTGGSTTISRTGVICGVFMVPVSANQLAPVFVTKRDGDNVIVPLEAGNAKFID